MGLITPEALKFVSDSLSLMAGFASGEGLTSILADELLEATNVATGAALERDGTTIHVLQGDFEGIDQLSIDPDTFIPFLGRHRLSGDVGYQAKIGDLVETWAPLNENGFSGITNWSDAGTGWYRTWTYEPNDSLYNVGINAKNIVTTISEVALSATVEFVPGIPQFRTAVGVAGTTEFVLENDQTAALGLQLALSDAVSLAYDYSASTDVQVSLLQNGLGIVLPISRSLPTKALETFLSWSDTQWQAVEAHWADIQPLINSFTDAIWEVSKFWSPLAFANVARFGIEAGKTAANLFDDVGDVVSDTVDTAIQASSEFWNFATKVPDYEIVSVDVAGVGSTQTTTPVVILDTDGDDLLTAPNAEAAYVVTGGQDRIEFSSGRNSVFELSGQNNTTIAGFNDDDTLVVAGTTLLGDQISYRLGSAIWEIDSGSDGSYDSMFRLEGDFAGQSFEVSSTDGDTVIRLARPEASQLSAAGERFITADVGANRVYGDGGDDVAVTGAGDDLISAGDGSDVVVAGAGMDTILGGLGADNLTGGADSDLFAFSARDFDPGFTADFITDFTPGEDVIELSGFGVTDLSSLNFVTVAEGDAIDLGAGRFIVLEGLTAADLSDGDVIGAEFARTYGLVSTTAVHRLTEAEDRFISTDTGASEIIGRAGADAIVGGTGDDTIRGEEGADVLIGGAGADVLIGGQGADQMTGLSGADEFIFTSGEETGFVADFITDYELGVDTLTLLEFGFASANDLSFTTVGSGDVALQLAPTRFVVFEGYTQQPLIENEADNWLIG